MKKFVYMTMVIVMTAMMGLVAHGEGMPAELKAFATEKVFQTEGELKGTWTIGLQRDENNLYPCAFDIGDGRIIIVPLTDSEVNELMCKALKEFEAKAAEEEAKNKEPEPTFIAKAVDWITFWN